MDRNICCKKVFSQNIIAKSIFKYINSLSDIIAVGKLSKNIYINAANFTINKSIQCESSYFFLDLSKNNENSSYIITRFYNSKEIVNIDNELNRLSKISREKVECLTKITIALSDVFNKLTITECFLYGEKLANFVNKLFLIFNNAHILEIINLKSEERNGFLFYFLRNLKNNNITIIDGIAFEDIITFSFRNQNEKIDIFNGLEKLNEISIYKENDFNPLSKHPKVKEYIYYLIDCLSKKNECTINFYRVDHPLSNDFLMKIVTYAQKNNINVKFNELSYPSGDFFASLLLIIKNINYLNITNITELKISLSNFSEINIIDKGIVLMKNLKYLRIHIQYDFYNILLTEYPTTISRIKIIYTKFKQLNLKKLTNLKFFSLQFPRMIWVQINKKNQELQEYLFQYITECLISILPNSITLLSLASVPIKNNNFFQMVSKNLPYLTKLLIKQNCIIPIKSLKYLKNLKFIYFPSNLNLIIPFWVHIVVIFNENPINITTSPSVEKIEDNILQNSLYKLLKSQYKNSIFYDISNHSKVFVFFNNIFHWEQYISLRLLKDINN
uniref:F-box domain-containing protein n=1 Tax=Strongyloides stercoralis TaxID=6248 RepID=A0A0K0ERN6_STRER